MHIEGDVSQFLVTLYSGIFSVDSDESSSLHLSF
jgi:hypothetical protein